MENHHDTWNTVQDLCVFVSNQETFAVEGFKLYCKTITCGWDQTHVLAILEQLSAYHVLHIREEESLLEEQKGYGMEWNGNMIY